MYISCLLLTLTSLTMLDSARQQVKDVKLTCTRPWQQSFLSGLTSMEGLLCSLESENHSDEWYECQDRFSFQWRAFLEAMPAMQKNHPVCRSCLRVWFIWIPRCKGWLRRWKHGVCFRGGNNDRLPWFVVPLTLPLIASECFGSGRNLHIFGFGHKDSTPLTWLATVKVLSRW